MKHDESIFALAIAMVVLGFRLLYNAIRGR